MAKVYVGYNKYGFEGVNEEFIQFVFDVTVSIAKLHPDSEVGLVVAEDDQMRSLNKQYRGKDKTTNILSFGYLETSGENNIPGEDKYYLGDIFISYPLVMSESGELGMTPKERFTHLFVHGLLHLSGTHHHTPTEEKKMESLEDEIITAIASAE